MDALWLWVWKQALRGAHTASIPRHQHRGVSRQLLLLPPLKDDTGRAVKAIKWWWERVGSMRYVMLTRCHPVDCGKCAGNSFAWFPLRVGSRCIYEHEWKSGDRNRPDVDRWTSEETITGLVNIPEGIVILREVKEQGSSSGETARKHTML